MDRGPSDTSPDEGYVEALANPLVTADFERPSLRLRFAHKEDQRKARGTNDGDCVRGICVGQDQGLAVDDAGEFHERMGLQKLRYGRVRKRRVGR